MPLTFRSMVRAFLLLVSITFLQACGGGGDEQRTTEHEEQLSVVLSEEASALSDEALGEKLEELGATLVNRREYQGHQEITISHTGKSPTDRGTWIDQLLNSLWVNAPKTRSLWVESQKSATTSIPKVAAAGISNQSTPVVQPAGINKLAALGPNEYIARIGFRTSNDSWCGYSRPWAESPEQALNECNSHLMSLTPKRRLANIVLSPTTRTANGIAFDYSFDEQQQGADGVWYDGGWNSGGRIGVVISAIWDYTKPSFTCPYAGNVKARTTDKETTYVCVDGKPPKPALPVEIRPNSCQAGMGTSNPIIPMSGEKVFTRTDVEDFAAHPLNFNRTYRTQWQIAPKGHMGTFWSHNHAASLRADPGDANKLTLQESDGAQRIFTRSAATAPWVNASHKDQLIATTTGAGIAAWKYLRAEDDSQWVFTQPTSNSAGLLQSVRQRDGFTYQYTYNANQQLQQVSNQLGRKLQFTYGANGLLASVIQPGGGTTQYTWDASARLQRVTYPDARFITYHHENASFPQHVTGITDENGQRYATYTYDSQGRAVSSELGTNIDKYTVAYLGTLPGFNTSASITDPLGTVRSFNYAQTNGRTDVTGGSTLPGCKGEPPIASRIQNAATGLVEEEVDFKRKSTLYKWDANRLLLTSVTRQGNPTQTTTTTWHPTLALPERITEPMRETQFAYDSAGRLLSQTVTHTAGASKGKVQKTSFTYNAAGLLSGRTDPNNAVTQFGQYTPLGLPNRIINPLGHVTDIVYDPMGRPLKINQPDGLVLTLTYDARGRLTSSSKTAQSLTLTTSYSYTPSGQLKTVSLPNGHVITYTHDVAQRVIGWSDNRGQSASYTLDGLGNITSEKTVNNGGTTALQISRSINNINRLASQTTGTAGATSYTYDANGQLQGVKDAANNSTSYTLDAFNRVSYVTNALGRSATFTYGTLDVPAWVTDFKGSYSVFDRDADGNTVSDQSIDTGLHKNTNTFDALGLPTRVVDALGRASEVTRDALGRPTLITQTAAGSPTLSIVLRYDLATGNCVAPNHLTAGKGRLCEIIDRTNGVAHSTMQYQWDSFGRLTAERRVLSSAIVSHSVIQLTQYAYVASGNGKGELATITYPSGSVLTHQYNAAGRLSGMLWNGKPLLENIQYNALNQPLSWNWAFADTNTATTLSATRAYNTAAQLTSSEFASFTPDTLGRISALTQGLYTANGSGGWALENVPFSAQYDALGRVTAFAANGLAPAFKRSHAYTWDPNGNRIGGSSVLNGSTQTDTHTLEDFSNRLATAFGSPVTTTVSGEVTGMLGMTLGYDAASRLKQVLANGQTTTHHYNGVNQRYARDRADEQTVFAYGADGFNLLSETTRKLSTSALSTTEHIYLPTASGPMPVAAVVNGVHYAVHSDRLNTPRRLTDANKVAKWQWAYSALGEVAPQSLPAAGQAAISYGLRYPGQLDDGNGLFYNWNRFYEPRTGRYTQDDPIGLEGGWNRFGYVGGNPLGFADPEGLQSRAAPPPQLTYSGGIAAARVGALLNQIRQYNPNYTYSSIRASRGPGSEYTNADVASLMGVLRGYQNPLTCSRNGVTIGRFIADQNGNVMMEPVGGSTGPYPPHRPNSPDTHTYYPNGSNYMRINPQGHGLNTTPHGHGHLPGTGPGRSGQGSSTDIFGNPVPSNSGAAHWPIY